MEGTLNLISKYLTKKNWIYDGTRYVFRNISFDDISTLKCEIHCILPEKGQTYTRLKFKEVVEEILIDVAEIFDEKISFYAEFYVDNEVAEDVYLSEKSKNEIRTELKNNNYFKIGDDFSCEVKLYPNFRKFPYIDSESIGFSCFWDIYNLHYKGVSVEVNDEKYDDAKSFIENYMLDNDYLMDVSDIYAEVLEPYFKFRGTDIYITVNGFLRNIDGKNLGDGRWDSSYTIKNAKSLFKKRV